MWFVPICQIKIGILVGVAVLAGKDKKRGLWWFKFRTYSGSSMTMLTSPNDLFYKQFLSAVTVFLSEPSTPADEGHSTFRQSIPHANYSRQGLLLGNELKSDSTFFAR